jgi:cyclopropane fatty-acyl-phospholipid synthase-like methyltransferase
MFAKMSCFIDKLISIIRSILYGIMMNPRNPNSTYNAYNLILDDIEEGSTILDVGSGDGVYFTNPEVVKKIKEKKLKIKCVDIDKNAINVCKYRTEKYKLTSFVETESIDLLKIKDKYDYVLFMDCYPVINIYLMFLMINHTKKLTENIFLYHNLYHTENTFLSFIKPKIKYFTFVDFGRLTTESEMLKVLENDWDFKDFEMKKIITSSFAELIGFIKIPYLNKYKLNQFLIKIKNN